MGRVTPNLRLDHARTRDINDGDGQGPKCSFDKVCSTEQGELRKVKRCGENAIVKINLYDWEQGISAGVYDMSLTDWSDIFSYFCDRCATVRLSYLQYKPDHMLISKQSKAPFYRTYQRYCRLIEEIDTQIQRCRAQWNIIINSRSTYLEDIFHLATTRVKFNQSHSPIIFTIRKRFSDAYIWDLKQIEHKNSKEVVQIKALGPIGFVQLFYIAHMKESVDKHKLKIDIKWAYWAGELKKVKVKRYEFTSVLEKDIYACRQKLSEMDRQQKQLGYEIERNSQFTKSFFVPFHMDKRDERGMYKNIKHKPYLTLNDFDTSYRKHAATGNNCDISEKLSATHSLDVKNLKNRNWAIPVVSFDRPRYNKFITRSALRSLISSVIYDTGESRIELKEVEITSEWQFGLCCVGSGRKFNEKSRLDAIYYRVAIKKWVKFDKMNEETDEEVLGDKRKYLVWCLDELKSNIHWMPSVGMVYELPDMLKPNVWPWQAFHVWYISPKLRDVDKWTTPETYFELGMQDCSQVDIEIHRFKDRWMSYKNYSLTSGTQDGTFKQVTKLPWSNFGNIEIKESKAHKVVQNFSFWWKNVLEGRVAGKF